MIHISNRHNLCYGVFNSWKYKKIKPWLTSLQQKTLLKFLTSFELISVPW